MLPVHCSRFLDSSLPVLNYQQAPPNYLLPGGQDIIEP